ncbi:MAG: hypothetical protein A2017_17950 [Lentisphaerae bacterium GWF2_44_16]|nr:MAG: hypothetical protein A2017_17950 [Lentisphaerae bacterium GWF2_44_16]
MRYINRKTISKVLPADWHKKAAYAAKEVAGTPDDERSKIINKKACIWQEIKDCLAKLSHKKCWYCESNIDRSDNAVDHFRPKNAVSGIIHSGYWWLAFEETNYRFSCTFCNSKRKTSSTSGGKQDEFPLLDEAKRAYSKNDDLDAEQPLLLDPLNESDVALLWFDQNGEAQPHPTLCKNKNGYNYKKVEKSIKLYHLNCQDTLEKRLYLASQIENKLQNSEIFLDKIDQYADTTAQLALNNSISELKMMISEGAEFSKFAETIIKGFRGTYRVADMIF